MEEVEKVKAPDDYHKQIYALGNDHIRYHTVQIFKKKNSTYSPEGTGVLFQIDELHLLLTAAHVLESMEMGEQLYFRIGKKDEFIGFGGSLAQIKNASTHEDLAALILPEQLSVRLMKIGLRFLPQNKSGHLDELNSSQYIIYGFPTKNMKYVEGIMETGGSLFLGNPTNDNPYRYYNLDREKICCLSYSYPRDLITGEKKKTTEPYGMSGSGLWFVSLFENGGGYNYDYSLVGIMTEFRKNAKYQILIGNKLSVIIEELERQKVISKK